MVGETLRALSIPASDDRLFASAHAAASTHPMHPRERNHIDVKKVGQSAGAGSEASGKRSRVDQRAQVLHYR
jgi:hypothetical protein